MSDFGTKLKKARKDSNVTQIELAKVLGVAQSTVANYEKNTRFPGLETLREISEFLNTSLDHLMGVDQKSKIINPEAYDKIDFRYTVDTFIDLLIEYKEERAKELIKEIFSKGISLTEIISRIFVPSLEYVGSGWQEGHITVAQEHYITAIIDRLTDYLSESQGEIVQKNLSAVFMVPGGEEHVLTLKMASEYFRSFGWRIKFIGSSVPIDGLCKVIIEEKASVLVMSALTVEGLNSSGYLNSALKSKLGKKAPITILGGKFDDPERVRTDTNTDIVLGSLESLKNEIPKIEEAIKSTV